MNRIFHARVPWYTLFFLILLLALTVWAYWQRFGLIAMGSLLLMVLLIERTIHTHYIVTTDGQLVIHRGRFSKRIAIPLDDIRRIERRHSVRIGSFSFTNYLLIHYDEPEKSLSLIPSDEDGLIAYIKKMRNK